MINVQVPNKDIIQAVMDSEDLYNLASAIRGPDSNTIGSLSAKQLFTARIRSLAGMTAVFGDGRPSPLISEEVLNRINQYRSDISDHYLGHVFLAIRSLRNMELISDSEYDFLVAVQTNILNRSLDVKQIMFDYPGFVIPYSSILLMPTQLQKKFDDEEDEDFDDPNDEPYDDRYDYEDPDSDFP